MAKDLSYVLDRDTFADQICCQGPSKAVRVDIAYSGLLAEGLYNKFHSLFGETLIWSFDTCEQSRSIIYSAIEVLPQVLSTDL